MTRVPVVLGLGPRVGAGTVAAALHAEEHPAHPIASGRDGGPRAADIAVCAGDEASLRRAEAMRGAAVLLVVLVRDTPPPQRARQRELQRRHGLVVVLPHVPQWAGSSGTPDAAALLARRPEHLPPALRAYTQGLRLAVAALLHGGGLARPHPPVLRWSPPTALRSAPPALCASSHARPEPPGSALDDRALDDDALEAEVLAAEARARRRAAHPPVRARHRPVVRPVSGPAPVAARTPGPARGGAAKVR